MIMFRLLAFATLFMVAVCLAIGVSIALADESVPPAAAVSRPSTIEAVDPDRRMVDDSLAANGDVYEFDFAVTFGAEPDPEFDEPSALLEI
jgi:hypothetical protein